MAQQVHIPNLFILVGQPDNGKTTLSKWFAQILGCPVIHTDRVYLDWLQCNYPKHYNSAKSNIRGHYPKLNLTQQREWNEYVADHIISIARTAPLYTVAEGWLLLHLPADIRAKIEKHVTTLTVHMKRFHAHVHNKSLRPKGRDYTNVVHGLLKQLTYFKGISLMRNAVKYQSFEDIRDYQGRSDSCGKWLALGMPPDLTGKRILDVGCGTGYFSIRCWQRGATVVGIDIHNKRIRTADRLAHAVYHTDDICFLQSDFFTFDDPVPYDYVLAVTFLPVLKGEYSRFFERAQKLLTPGGTLVVETSVVTAAKAQPTDLHERAILAMAKDFRLTYRGRSVRMRGDKRRRVYHFLKLGEHREASTHPESVLHSGRRASGEEHTHATLPYFS